jgi:hypothetical protein
MTVPSQQTVGTMRHDIVPTQQTGGTMRHDIVPSQQIALYFYNEV